MIKIENVWEYDWRPMLRGLRNPMNSWEKSDSGLGCKEFGPKCDHCGEYDDTYADCGHKQEFIIGPNDHELMMKLCNAGTDHRKFMRMIMVSLDIVAPLYWWKEFDQYKVGTVTNSCSTMHKIHAKEFTLDDFSCEYLIKESIEELENVIEKLNKFRNKFINWKQSDFFIDNDSQLVDKKVIWWQMIQLLPSSYNQRRTVMINYEVLANMYKSRKNHKLDEWRDFCRWVETLPYSELITGE